MENVTAIQETKVIGIREKLAAFFELTKPRIAFMLVLTSAAAFYVGTKGSFDFVLFGNAMIGIAITRETIRHTRAGVPKSVNTKIVMIMTMIRKFVPQRTCRVEYLRSISAGSRSSPRR